MASTSVAKSSFRSEKHISQSSASRSSSGNPPIRWKVPSSSKRSVTPNSKASSIGNDSEDNVQDIISSGALKEPVRISCESSREDMRSLAKRTLRLTPTFQAAMRTL